MSELKMSNSQKLKSYLEVITTVAVLLAAVAVVKTYLFSPTQKSAAQLQSGLQKGATLEPLPGVDYGDSPQTLLIAMNTHCGFCKESIPFYNQLAELQRNNKSTRAIAIFPNSEDEVRQYVKQQQLGLNAIATVDFNKLSLAGTPTMILVDKSGKVLDFWVGKLSTDAEQQVISEMKQ